MLKCTKCGEVKDPALFGIKKSAKTGRNSQCKQCDCVSSKSYATRNREKVRAAAKAWRDKNPDYAKKKNASFYAENRDREKSRAAEYRAQNPEKVKSTTAAWRKENAERYAEIKREYRANNADRVAAYRKSQYEKNRDEELSRMKVWRKENPHRVNAATAKRTAAKLRATPVWANLKKIEEFYEMAALASRSTGICHHVDHIIPLQSKTVCGLHCEANLQVISGPDNQSKGNRHWPDMP